VGHSHIDLQRLEERFRWSDRKTDVQDFGTSIDFESGCVEKSSVQQRLKTGLVEGKSRFVQLRSHGRLKAAMNAAIRIGDTKVESFIDQSHEILVVTLST